MAETLIASYSETNQDDDILIPYDTPHYVGQTFTGNGLKLSSCKFYLKYYTPDSVPLTGNITAELFAHTGTYGTNGKPTGSAVATSTIVNANTIGTSFALVPFVFDGTYTLVNGTYYCLAIHYDGTDVTRYLWVGMDSSSPAGFPGNVFDDGGPGWEGYNWYAVCFYVYGTTPVTTSISKVARVAQASISKIVGVSMASIKKLSGVANS